MPVTGKRPTRGEALAHVVAELAGLWETDFLQHGAEKEQGLAADDARHLGVHLSVQLCLGVGHLAAHLGDQSLERVSGDHAVTVGQRASA